MIYRTPGGTRIRLKKGARPILHSWNNFSVSDISRKPPCLRQCLKKVCRPQHENVDDDSSTSTPLLPKLNEVDSSSTTSFLMPINKADSFSSTSLSAPLEEVDFTIDIAEGKLVEDERNDLKKRIIELEKENQILNVNLERCNEFLGVRCICFTDHVMENNENCNHYTGFPSINILKAVLEFLDPGENGRNIILYNNKKKTTSSSTGRPRALKPLDAFILTLTRLRRNFDLHHLSFLYNISEGTVSNTVNTCINFMYIRLGSICIWPSMEQVRKTMPQSMKEKFPTVKCIIDCVEFKVETPSELFMHKVMYSDYKIHTTVKVLVGIAPGGGFTFISNAYPGSISDKEIVIKSGFLSQALWNPGESVMSDRGFTIAEYLRPLGVNLVLPSFLKGREQFTIEETVLSQQIANERIHVERMIQRLKCYHIFDYVIPMNMMGSLNQIISVAALLSNFQDPIIKI
nr:uncharacterized protein LOC105847414 [Hydra vulgaris]